jgi:hypothetical protein
VLSESDHIGASGYHNTSGSHVMSMSRSQLHIPTFRVQKSVTGGMLIRDYGSPSGSGKVSPKRTTKFST